MRSWPRGSGWHCRCPKPSARESPKSSWRSRRASTELRHELAVELVAEHVARVGDGEPAQLVDLVVRRELALLGAHLEVAHELRAVLVVRVGRVAHLAPQRATEPGLLPDLAQRRLLEVLALVELALREAPVVVLGAVHDRDLAVAQHEAARGEDLRVLRCYGRCGSRRSSSSSGCSRRARPRSAGACPPRARPRGPAPSAS